MNSSFKINSQVFTHEIIPDSFGGSPIDNATLFKTLVRLGYQFNQSDDNTYIGTKNKSTVTFYNNTSRIFLESTDFQEHQNIVSEVLDVIIKNCEFDSKNYSLVHQFTATLSIDAGHNPNIGLNNNFLKESGDKIIHDTFGEQFTTQSIRLHSGIPFTKDTCNIIIEPVQTRSNRSYHVIMRFRGDYKKIENMRSDFENKIEKIFDKMSKNI